METDSCEPRRGWGELLWEREHLCPARSARGGVGPSFLQSNLQPPCWSVRPSRAVFLFPCLSLSP